VRRAHVTAGKHCIQLIVIAHATYAIGSRVHSPWLIEKDDINFELLDRKAYAMTDNQSADKLQKTRRLLFKTIMFF